MTDSVKIPCPKCQQKQKLRLEHLGRRLTCGRCQHKFWPEILMGCPSCGRGTRVKMESIGRSVLCEHCEHYFEASLRLPCPWCRRSLRIKPRYIGHSFVCKDCNRRSGIQLQGTQIVLFPASSPSEPPAPQEQAEPGQQAILLQQLQAARDEVSRLTKALAEERARAASEQRRWQEEQAALQRQQEQERLASAAAYERLRQDLEDLRHERDDALQQLQERQLTGAADPLPTDSGHPITTAVLTERRAGETRTD